MTNPKGTQAETAFVRYVRERGFGQADRLTKTGAADRGDVLLCPGLMAELKNTNSVKDGGPAPKQLHDWMQQTRIEAINGDTLGFLVVKRTGTSDVGRWFAFIESGALTGMIAGGYDFKEEDLATHRAIARTPVCLQVDDLLRVLRFAGWGDSLAGS